MWQKFGQGEAILEDNLILSFLSLSLDLLHKHHVHVKQIRLDPKIHFLVHTILDLIFLIANRDVKIVSLCIFLL